MFCVYGIGTEASRSCFVFRALALMRLGHVLCLGHWH